MSGQSVARTSTSSLHKQFRVQNTIDLCAGLTGVLGACYSKWHSKMRSKRDGVQKSGSLCKIWCRVIGAENACKVKRGFGRFGESNRLQA